MNSAVIPVCFGEIDPTFFSFSLVPDLILYSHVPAALVALLLVFFLLRAPQLQLKNLLLAGSLFFFAYWVIANIHIWGTNRADIVIFHWSIQILVEPLVYIGIFYLVWTYLKEQSISHRVLFLFALLYIPLILITPTRFSLAGMNLTDCVPDESFYSYYTYVLEGASLLGILFVTFWKRRSSDILPEKRAEVFYLGVGAILFLLAFGSGNIFGSYTGEWVKSQFGLFGMPIFGGFLTYLIVRYQAFNIKLIATQALVFIVFLLVGSQFFYVKSYTNFLLTGVTFILVLIAGFFLVRSVKYEIKQKEDLEKISQSLALANERLKELDKAKSEFISIASHQLRTPLTAIKGYVSLLLEGSYGVFNKDVNDVLNKLYSVNDRLVHLVEDLLNVSRIEAGRIQYNFQPTQLADILKELHDMFLMTAKDKGLAFDLLLPPSPLPLIIVDPNKIKEICSNLIDNAIKYTPTGSITVTLSQAGENARIVIADTGIGIKPEDQEHLFTKFVRSKETSRMVVSGAGLGLFVGKSFVLAHKGNIWAESEGPGKGSKFIMELPLENPGLQIGIIDKKQEA